MIRFFCTFAAAGVIAYGILLWVAYPAVDPWLLAEMMGVITVITTAVIFLLVVLSSVRRRRAQTRENER